MKATKAQIEARVTELLRIRLDGAEFWDIREYVREKEQEDDSPWKLTDGQKPLSDSQLWRYLARVDQAIAASCVASRKKLIRRHLAQRRSLYAKAVSQGDIRAALACQQDEAELLGLYPPKRTELSGKGGGPVTLNIIEEVVGPAGATPPGIVEEVVTNGNGTSSNAPHPEDPLASRAASLPPQ
jgi:hypothetical protein